MILWWSELWLILAEGAQWLSDSAWLETKRPGLEPHRFHCFVSLSKTHLSLLSTGSTQEDLLLHNWKIVDWDVKKSKQTNNNVSWQILKNIFSQNILTNYFSGKVTSSQWYDHTTKWFIWRRVLVHQLKTQRSRLISFNGPTPKGNKHLASKKNKIFYNMVFLQV